jgi:hypothetical protein
MCFNWQYSAARKLAEEIKDESKDQVIARIDKERIIRNDWLEKEKAFCKEYKYEYPTQHGFYAGCRLAGALYMSVLNERLSQLGEVTL